MEKRRFFVTKRNLETGKPTGFGVIGSAKIAANASIDELPPPGIEIGQLSKEKPLPNINPTQPKDIGIPRWLEPDLKGDDEAKSNMPTRKPDSEPIDRFSATIRRAAEEFEKHGGRDRYPDFDD